MSALRRPAAKREPLAKSLPGEQRLDEPRDLRRVGRAVGVEHHDDVAAGRREAARERVALAAPVLQDDAHVGADRAGDRDRVVDSSGRRRGRPRRPMPGSRVEDVRQVRRLVERRDHDADRRPAAVRVAIARSTAGRHCGGHSGAADPVRLACPTANRRPRPGAPRRRRSSSRRSLHGDSSHRLPPAFVAPSPMTPDAGQPSRGPRLLTGRAGIRRAGRRRSAALARTPRSRTAPGRSLPSRCEAPGATVSADTVHAPVKLEQVAVRVSCVEARLVTGSAAARVDEIDPLLAGTRGTSQAAPAGCASRTQGGATHRRCRPSRPRDAFTAKNARQ